MASNRAFSGWLFGFLILVFLFGVGFSAFAKCTDTDASNLNKKGTITGVLTNGTEYSYEDFCKSDSNDKVVEFMCKPSGLASAVWKCADGKVCKDGACVKKEEPKAAVCTDSDGGKKYYKKGTATIPGVTTSTDSCNEDGFLNEIYCYSDKVLSSEKFTCPSGYKCSDGACVKKLMSSSVPKSTPLGVVNVSSKPVSTKTTCVDTDGWGDKNKKGTTTIYNADGSVKASASDSCVDPYTVNEGECKKDGSDWVYAPLKCGTGFSCKEGACVKPTVVSTSCTDSDGGEISNVKGITTTTSTYSDGTIKSFSIEDKCVSIDYVKENFCDKNGNINTVQKTCQTGNSSVCTNGACKSGSGSTGNNSSGQLKKTKLREFLLATGIETEKGVPTFLKPWRINTGTLLDNLFQSEEE